MVHLTRKSTISWMSEWICFASAFLLGNASTNDFKNSVYGFLYISSMSGISSFETELGCFVNWGKNIYWELFHFTPNQVFSIKFLKVKLKDLECKTFLFPSKSRQCKLKKCIRTWWCFFDVKTIDFLPIPSIRVKFIFLLQNRPATRSVNHGL